MPRKVFVAGEILTAADVNTNLMDQAVMVFDDDAARTTAIPSPVEGMVTYLKDTDAVEKYVTDWEPVTPPITSGDLPAGSILQVVSTTETDRFSSSSGSFVDVTGLTATITPRDASSKILAFGAVPVSANDSNIGVALILVRGSTEIGSGTPAGSRLGAITVGNSNSSNQARTAGGQQGTPFVFLDSPNTTSATTYKIQARVTAGGSFAINGNQGDTNSATAENSRTQSTITLMEVAG